VNDDDTSTTTSFELVIIFLYHFSQPLCIVISLFDHIYSSAALKKNINTRSLTMRVRIFQPQCYVPIAVLRVGYAEVIFIQPDRKLDTM